MLTKLPTVTFVPAVPGQDYAPAESWCAPAPVDTGTWVYTCTRMELPAPGEVFLMPPGAEIVDDVDGAYVRVCSAQWVPGPGVVADPVCYDIPEQPYIPSVPARYDVSPNFGWNAGANSIDVLDGDLHVSFTMDAAIGVGVGFVTDLDNIGGLDRILYGLYFHSTIHGESVFNFIEDGKVVGDSITYAIGDAFDIQRGNASVSYWHNGTRVRTARKLSTGELNVGSALYASGDNV